jgi:ATP-binding cassette subfamily B protein
MAERFPFLELVRELPRAGRGLTVALASVLTLAGVAPALAALVAGQLINKIPSAIAGRTERPVVVFLLVLAGLFLLQQLAGPAALQLAGALGRRLTGRLRDRVMGAALAPSGLAAVEQPAAQDLLAGATEVGTARVTPQEALVAGVSVATLRLQGICCAVVLGAFHWWLAAALLVGYFFLARVAVGDFRAGAKAGAGSGATLRRSEYLRTLGIDAGAAKDLRLFGLRGWLDWRFHKEWLAAISRAPSRGSWLGARLAAAMLASQLVVYVLLTLAAGHGEISAGAFVTYSGAVLGIVAVLSVSPDNINLVLGARAVPRVAELEEMLGVTAAPLGAGAASLEAAAAPAGLTEGISVRDLWFTYPGSSTPVFAGLDLDIIAGQSLAIVGLNGAGKTTLVKLLCRLYEPDRGQILVDGITLSSIDPGQWRARIAAVFQDFVRFQLTAADNVRFGYVAEIADTAGLESSAVLTGADTVAERLPDGWDTSLGDGQELSGGQWQRLALARGMFAVRHGARLLILDEPTAALDVRAEARIYQQMLAATHDITTIIISHRFSTVRPADRIIVLSGGRVIEDGNHDALLRYDGEYARMFRLQAASFLDPDSPEPSEEAS